MWWIWCNKEDGFLPMKVTITAVVYCQQLQRLEVAIQEGRSERHRVILRMLTSHSSHFPDLAPSDFHLFRYLWNSLPGIPFSDEAALQNWLGEFITSKRADFFRSGIEKPPDCWKEMVNNGEYILDKYIYFVY